MLYEPPLHWKVYPLLTSYRKCTPPPEKYTPSVSQENLIAMLQQQQPMLQQVLEGQKLFERRQDYFDDQLADLASKVERPIPTTPSSSSSEGKRKRVVTRTLSVSLTIMLAMYAILTSAMY